MADDFVTRIGWLYTGQGEVEKFLADQSRVTSSSEALNRLSQGIASGPRKSAFEGLSPQTESGLMRTTLREVDELTRAQIRLRDAELARAQAHKQLSISDPASKYYNPAHPKFVGEFNYDAQGKKAGINETGSIIARERLDDRTRAAVDAAADNLKKVFERVQKLKTQVEADARKIIDAHLTGTQSGLIEAPRFSALGNARAALQAIATQSGTWAQYERELAKRARETEAAAQTSAAQRRSTLSSLYQVRRPELYTPSESLQQQQLYDANKGVTYPAANPRTPVGKAQEGVNSAERRLIEATLARTRLYESGVPTAQQLIASDRVLAEAKNRLSAATSQLARVEAAAASRSQRDSFSSQFGRGFRGASDRPYAEQIGQAFKFSVFYGTAYKLLFGLTQTLQQTLQEGIEFESAMTELKIASGQSADAAKQLADGLGEQATLAGAAPSQGMLLGARSLGLFGATGGSGASLADQERIAEISARTALRASLGSKTDPQEIQTQLAAVSNAFGLGAEGQIRVADLDAYLGRRFGVLQGQTTQAVAESGTVGQAAGFSMEELFSISAALQSRSGQTASAVSGFMAQIFSRGGEGTLSALGAKYGVDQTQNLADQIKDLAVIYKDVDDNERNAIAAGFGRGKVQNAGGILLTELPKIMAESVNAETNATGAADEIFELRIGNIGGQIQITTAILKEFASELGHTGILEVLGAFIVVARELVEAGTGLLKMWNSLSGTTRGVIAALVALAVAGRAAAGSQAVWGAISAARGGGVAAGARSLGGSVASAGAMAGAIAGLYAISEIVSSSKKLKSAQEDAADALNMLVTDNNPDSLRARAGELKSQATQSRESSGSFINKLIPELGNEADKVNNQAGELDSRARDINRIAAIAQAQRDAAAAATETPLITGFDTDSLKGSLEAITAAGGSAEDRFRALADAVRAGGEAARTAAQEFDVGDFASLNSEALVGILADNITGIDGKKKAPSTVRESLSGIGNVSPDIVIGNTLGQNGITDLKSFDHTKAIEAAKALVEKTNSDSSFVGTQEYNNAVDAVADFLIGQVRNARIMVDSSIKLTPAEATNGITSLVAEAQAAASQLQETDYSAKTKNARQLVRGINQYFKRTDGNATNTSVEALASARRALAQSQFDELENLRRAAQRNAKGRAEVAKQGARFLRRELKAAIKGGNQDLLATIIGQAGSSAVKIAEAIINEAINAAREARQVFLQIEAVKRAAQSVLGAEIEYVRGGMGQAATSSPQLAAAQQMANALPTMQTAGSFDDDVYSSGSDVPGYESPKDPPKGKSPEDKKAEREAARQEMLDLRNNLYLLSIDLSDPLALAVAAVKDARRRLQSDVASGQPKGTVAASRVALRQAQIEREATAFQQRLDAVQTAEELGRISHRKYISYLENERKRLGAIKNRTYQQQQQLDEIDRLMQSAAESMQGQWNFGDIKLPTPYQVRRQVEQMRTDRATSLDATSRQAQNITTIQIDGADTGKVRQIIKETLGKANATVTTRPRRR